MISPNYYQYSYTRSIKPTCSKQYAGVDRVTFQGSQRKNRRGWSFLAAMTMLAAACSNTAIDSDQQISDETNFPIPVEINSVYRDIETDEYIELNEAAHVDLENSIAIAISDYFEDLSNYQTFQDDGLELSFNIRYQNSGQPTINCYSVDGTRHFVWSYPANLDTEEAVRSEVFNILDEIKRCILDEGDTKRMEYKTQVSVVEEHPVNDNNAYVPVYIEYFQKQDGNRVNILKDAEYKSYEDQILEVLGNLRKSEFPELETLEIALLYERSGNPNPDVKCKDDGNLFMYISTDALDDRDQPGILNKTLADIYDCIGQEELIEEQNLLFNPNAWQGELFSFTYSEWSDEEDYFVFIPPVEEDIEFSKRIESHIKEVWSDKPEVLELFANGNVEIVIRYPGMAAGGTTYCHGGARASRIHLNAKSTLKTLGHGRGSEYEDDANSRAVLKALNDDDGGDSLTDNYDILLHETTHLEECLQIPEELRYDESLQNGIPQSWSNEEKEQFIYLRDLEYQKMERGESILDDYPLSKDDELIRDGEFWPVLLEAVEERGDALQASSPELYQIGYDFLHPDG